jgi:muramoyltetrapeptide carboxypeptidase
MLGVEMAHAMDPWTEEMFWAATTSARKLLLGGNLSMVVSLLATPYQPDFSDSVIFLEDVAEEPYRVDRMMMQLRNSSILSRSSALLTGQFIDCVPSDRTKPSLTVDEVLLQAAAATERPFLANLPFGHVPRKMTLPVGLRVRVDAGNGTVEYLESACR